MKKHVALCLAILFLLIMFTACTQTNKTSETENKNTSDYPEDDIDMIIPFGEGGGTDEWARIIAQYMGEELGVQIDCSNITGGSAGSTGIKTVWNAPHDGYTLAATSETPLTIPVMTTDTQTTDDWEYFIAAGSPGVLCVNKNTSEQTMQEIIEKLQNDPESLSIAGASGGLWFAQAQLFNAYADTAFQWVSYPGSGDAIKATFDGVTDAVVASAGEVKAYVDSGDFIPVAIMGTEAWEFPGYGEVMAVTDALPILKEYLPLNQAIGFKIPADTDPQIIAILQEAFIATMQHPDVINLCESETYVHYGYTGEQAKEMMKDIESKLTWILYDMGQTTFSPEERGIERP